MDKCCYLILVKGRGYHSFRIAGIRSKRPQAAKDKVVVKLTVDVPNNLFDEQTPEATLTIDETHIQAPTVEVKPVAAEREEGS